MAECEIELRFKISGRVESLSNQAVVTIQVLNLNSLALIQKRKKLSNDLLFANSINPDEGLEDEDLLEMLIGDLLQPKLGQMEPFTPVVINILQSWLQS